VNTDVKDKYYIEVPRKVLEKLQGAVT